MGIGEEERVAMRLYGVLDGADMQGELRRYIAELLRWPKIEETHWADRALEDPTTVIFDSATTGLSFPSDFIEIAVLDRKGRMLLHSYVKPAVEIEPEATAVHGYETADLEDAPMFPEVYSELRRVLSGRRIIVWNAPYDRRVMREAVHRYRDEETGAPLDDQRAIEGWKWECAMRHYSRYVAEYARGYDDWRYQKLPGGDHTAIGDARATLHALRSMADADTLPY